MGLEHPWVLVSGRGVWNHYQPPTDTSCLLRTGTAGSWVFLFLMLCGTTALLSAAAAPFHFPTDSAQGSGFSASSPALYFVVFPFDQSHPHGCEVFIYIYPSPFVHIVFKPSDISAHWVLPFTCYIWRNRKGKFKGLAWGHTGIKWEKQHLKPGLSPPCALSFPY